MCYAPRNTSTVLPPQHIMYFAPSLLTQHIMYFAPSLLTSRFAPHTAALLGSWNFNFV